MKTMLQLYTICAVFLLATAHAQTPSQSDWPATSIAAEAEKAEVS